MGKHYSLLTWRGIPYTLIKETGTVSTRLNFMKALSPMP